MAVIGDVNSGGERFEGFRIGEFGDQGVWVDVKFFLLDSGTQI